MATTLTVVAVEQSTYVITVAFFDEDDSAVVPATATWTLTDESGAVINEREDEAITPAETVDIVLQGNDLPVSGTTSRTLVLTVSATYNSSLGSGLPLVAVARFEVEGQVA